MKIAYICYETQAKYTVEEAENNNLLLFLQQKGLDICKEVWTDQNADWEKYEVAILKAPWDYHENISQFYKWLDEISRLQVNLLNPAAIVKWNSDKHYLKNIAEAGFSVPQSEFLEKGNQLKLNSYFGQLNTDKLIVKPCISAGSNNTFAVMRKDITEVEPMINELLKTGSYIVQPFLEEIQTEGEWSFVFFNSQFSHCLLKKAGPGDFRVQNHLGGSVHIQLPPSQHLKTAEAIIARFAKECLYARVDGVIVNNEFRLMELELIDPYLYLSSHLKSFNNYYHALTKTLTSIRASRLYQ